MLAILAAVLLIVAFPDFEWWFTAWFALVPLMWAVEREKESVVRSFAVGWLFGTAFFFGTCWWLTFAPINYAGFPPWLAYSGMLFVAAAVGLFPALFAGILAVLLRRFGSWGFVAAPFVWVFSEFLRYWLTGNNWNAIGYSQAFSSFSWPMGTASVGGVHLISFNVVFFSAYVAFGIVAIRRGRQGNGLKSLSFDERLALYSFSVYLNSIIGLILFFLDPEFQATYRRPNQSSFFVRFAVSLAVVVPISFSLFVYWTSAQPKLSDGNASAYVVAVQPNVPMSGVSLSDTVRLRDRHVELSDGAFSANLQKMVDEKLGKRSEVGNLAASEEFGAILKDRFARLPKLVVFPESPMNFMYHDDREFQQYVGDFARRNNVSVLFNSAEPDATNGKYFNSAVLVSPEGREAGQYDKIFLLPFGEAVPPPFDAIMPGFVGNFSYGREYDILPVGDAKAGVMICFESHFGQLSRRFVADGADVLIEMTNDGYLGPTPVLRQHLANAVFRAVETNRPVLRVTNVGITTYINEKGAVLDPTAAYQENTRVWSVSKSDGQKTFYVKYGDWFAWLCSLVTVGMLVFAIAKKDAKARL